MKSKMTMRLLLGGAIALACTTVLAQKTVPLQGVTKTEILVGTILDKSGPLAAYGKAIQNGMQLRINEINEQGGIHGRKIRLAVEDDGYDPKKSVLAAQKLVNQDKIFIMAGHLGTAQNLAAMPVQFEKNVINFFPVTAAREMYEPLHKLKYSFAATYYDQMRTSLPDVIKEKKSQKVCIIYQDDDFGLEVLRGAEEGLKTLNMSLVEKTSFKRGATDFSSQVAKMKSSGCDFVVLGTIIRETIGTIGESRKTGFNPVFFGSSAAYTDLIHKLGGPAMNGLYATMTVQHPYLDDAAAPLRFWANKYKTSFGDDPNVFSAYGYVVIDAFIRGANKAGPNLTTETFINAMDSITIPPDIFGSPEATFSATKRLGNHVSRLSQIINGRWTVISEYPQVAKAAAATSTGAKDAKKAAPKAGEKEPAKK